MKDGCPGLVTMTSQSIHLMVGAQSLGSGGVLIADELAAIVATTRRCAIPPAFIKDSFGSASRSLGYSLPSDSLVGEFYGADVDPKT